MAEEWNRRFCHLGRSGQGILLCPFTAKHQVALAIEILVFWMATGMSPISSSFSSDPLGQVGHFRMVELHRNPDPMLKLSSRTEKGSARFIFLTPEFRSHPGVRPK
jgi:hypothetical protein